LKSQPQNPNKRIKWSRRAFLRLALLTGIAAGSGIIYKSTEVVGFDRWFRWMIRGSAARILAPQARVALARCSAYDAALLSILRTVWSDARMPVLNGARVVLKPNLVDYVQGQACFTDPRLTQAMIQLAREMGARDICVAEGTTFRRDAQAILDATGYAEMLARERVEFIDLNYDDLVSIPLTGSYTRLRSLYLAKTILTADVLISMPKMKTHHWTAISGSMKNLFGVVPGIKYGWPKNTLHIQGIPAFLTQLTDSLATRTCAVVDGIVGLQGDGPIFGSPVPSGVIVAGKDLVATDATCARLMGFDPAQIDYLDFAAWAGVGFIDAAKIDLVGESLSRMQRYYERPPTMK
jgi:uncharacterized protein (DUF362 family)